MAEAFPLVRLLVATHQHERTARVVNSATLAARHRADWFSENFAVLVSVVFGHISHMDTTRALYLQFNTCKTCVNTPCRCLHFQSHFNIMQK
ncbi:unnamed protein product [Ixodes hexagonus]